jgi:NNP family nitrate/nitrite transporter-like MFS transporter
MFFSLVAGLLVDRFGSKRVFTISYLITAIGAVTRIWADSFISMYMAMVLIGVHATFLNVNGSKVFGYWFEPKKVGTLMGVFIAVVNGAMALGMGTGALFPSLKSAFVMSSALIIGAALLWVVFARDGAPKEGGQSCPKGDGPSVSQCIKKVAGSRNIWIVGLVLMLMCAGSTALNMFLPTALVSQRGFDEARAGAVGMAIMIGSAISCFVTPIIDAKLKNTKALTLTYGLLGAAGVAFAWQAPEGALLPLALSVTGFFTNGLGPLIMSIPIQLPEIGPTYAGTAGGVVATIQLVGSVVIPTYIITPISGSNYSLLFGLCGIVLLLFAIASQMLPNPAEKAKPVSSKLNKAGYPG